MLSFSEWRIMKFVCRSEWGISIVLCCLDFGCDVFISGTSLCHLRLCCLFKSFVRDGFKTQQPPLGPKASSLLSIDDHTQTHAHSVGLLWTGDQPDTGTYTWQHTTLTTYRVPSAIFEPVIPASEQQQTHALDRADTGTGTAFVIIINKGSN